MACFEVFVVVVAVKSTVPSGRTEAVSHVANDSQQLAPPTADAHTHTHRPNLAL